MAFLVTTTGTLNPVVLNDIGGRSIPHPIVDLDLALEFSSDELANSLDLQAAITAGYLTAKDELGNSLPIVGTGSALTVPTGDFSTEQSIWTKVTDGILIFPGTDQVTVSGAKISAYMDTGPTDYDLQVLDITHGSAVISSLSGETELVPMTFTNLIPITNLPTGPACFELQVRRNGGSPGEKVYVEAWMLAVM